MDAPERIGPVASRGDSTSAWRSRVVRQPKYCPTFALWVSATCCSRSRAASSACRVPRPLLAPKNPGIATDTKSVAHH